MGRRKLKRNWKKENEWEIREEEGGRVGQRRKHIL